MVNRYIKFLTIGLLIIFTFVLTQNKAQAAVPSVKSITPHVGRNNNSVSNISISGSNFVTGATVKLTKTGQADINCNNFSGSGLLLTGGSCNINGVIAGNWNVKVTNPDNQPDTLTGGFTISSIVIGSLISSTIDTGLTSGVNFNSIWWRGASGMGGATLVKFQLATSNCSNGAMNAPTCTSGTWTYLGPSLTNLDLFYTPTGPNSPVAISAKNHKNQRYYRYKLFLERADTATSPRVNDVIVNWAR